MINTLSILNIDGIASLLSLEIIEISTRIPAYLKYNAANNIGKIPLREIIKSKIMLLLHHLNYHHHVYRHSLLKIKKWALA
jgi:hypothetical protein